MAIERSQSRGKDEENLKLFITNLDASINPLTIETELKKLFRKYGTIWKTSAKLNRNGAYCFAFIDYEKGSDLDGAVEDIGCYKCGKDGHFARECTSPIEEIIKHKNRDEANYKNKGEQPERYTIEEKFRQKSKGRDRYQKGSLSRDRSKRRDYGDRTKSRSKSKEFSSESSSSSTNSSSSSRSSSEEYYKKRQRRVTKRRNKISNKRNKKDMRKRDEVKEERSREKGNNDKKQKRKSRRTDSCSSSSSSRSNSKSRPSK